MEGTMKTPMVYTLLVTNVIVVWGIPATRAQEPHSAVRPSVAELIDQLGNPHFRERDAASRELVQRPDAVTSLRAAVKSANPEIARRAQLILDLRNGLALHRAFEPGKQGSIDLMVER